ncbi:mannosyltransferase-like protein [Trypanosoma grayi]|uniref:mannosyltransferase-like protein n=1 Tax=Trypanosoma grayi TaxID=71804 RepID=UPI0004F4A330|nr:mannosyltransferase-like protein [Trypanosoma grayi]KEG13077.1 mannosyltransferase-like protein [Trypanosoma grayi]
MRRRFYPAPPEEGDLLVTFPKPMRTNRKTFMLAVLLLLLSLCAFVLCIPHGAIDKNMPREIGDDDDNAPTKITLLLPTVMDAEKTLREWLNPSAALSDVVCAGVEAQSGPYQVSVVVVQMERLDTDATNRIGRAMPALVKEFPERQLSEGGGILDIAAEGSWHAWRFTDTVSTEQSCVREVALVAVSTEPHASLGGYDALDRYVKVGLSALPYHTEYFLIIADFLLPVVLAENLRYKERFGHHGFMQRLLSVRRHNKGRVAAVQCTILARRSASKGADGTHGEEAAAAAAAGADTEAWNSFSAGVPVTPLFLHLDEHERNSTHLSGYVALDKGAFVGYGTNWNSSVRGQFFTRRLNGYSALDERVRLLEEPIDAVSPFCSLWHRGAFDAVGGFAPSVRQYSSAMPGTRGWSLVRETPPPDDPENDHFIVKWWRLENNFPTLWPDVLQADDFAGWELSFRLQLAFPEWQLWSSTAMAVAWTTPMQLVARHWGIQPPIRVIPQTVDQQVLSYYAPSFVMTGDFAREWGAFAGRLFRNRLSVQQSQPLNNSTSETEYRKAPLIELRVLSNYGVVRCSGMMIEGMHYIVPLQRRVMVSFWGFRSLWCPGSPQGAMDALYRTQMGVNRWGYLGAWRQQQQQQQPQEELKEMREPPVGTSIETATHTLTDKSPVVRITFLHNSPRYVDSLGNKEYTSDYGVARILTETSRLRAYEAKNINLYVDELWVTCNFFKEIYKRSGVREELIYVVPESLDPYLINPDLYAPFDDLPELALLKIDSKWTKYWTNRPHEVRTTNMKRRYRFLSIFKWEMRKGWDVLLSSYWKAFGPGTPLHENVSLYIKLSFVTNHSDGQRINNIEQKLTQWATDVARLPNFTSMRQFPHLVIIYNPTLRNEDVYRLYRSADAFVLPTRGEGWGMPAMEAMSMGLPVLTTNWGGSTAFATRENSFLIPVDGLEDVVEDVTYGHMKGRKWALPSIDGTAKLMVYVATHPEHARAVGRRARQDIVSTYSEEAVADMISERLRDIALKVGRRWNVRWPWGKMVL